MRWPRSGHWGPDRGGSQSRGRDFAVFAPPEWGQHLQEVETNYPYQDVRPLREDFSVLCSITREGNWGTSQRGPAWKSLLLWLSDLLRLTHSSPVLNSLLQIFPALAVLPSRSLAPPPFFPPFPEISSFVLFLIYASSPEFTHTSLSSPPLPSLNFHPPVSLPLTQIDLKLAFEGQPQANGVDLVWIILDLIQEWVGGSLELCKGSLMIWLLSGSAVTHSSGLIAQPLWAIFLSVKKEAGLGQP